MKKGNINQIYSRFAFKRAKNQTHRIAWESLSLVFFMFFLFFLYLSHLNGSFWTGKAKHAQKIDMNGASTKYTAKHAKHPTPPPQNKHRPNLLPSSHETNMQKNIYKIIVQQTGVLWNCSSFLTLKLNLTFYLEKVGVCDDPALAWEVSALHYFVEKTITRMIYSFFSPVMART